ncbi:Hypothetical predicted protein [Pelobates cultripes]|uniref:Helix-turn-helix domain-containing protein n=1 Tax=Pelobates cultripes TaxID=61616 RepID=A0AAD1RFT6_PELCU|nr:Hypothetical predicted protein [Pelobates cultripes]
MEATEMVQYLNGLDTPIRFTSNISASSVQYLDLEILIKNHEITHCLYKKDTDRNTLLHNNSAHPRMLKKSLPKAQFLRVARNNSDESKMEEQIEEMTEKFLERGYRRQDPLKAQQDAKIASSNTVARKAPELVFPMSYNDASPKVARVIKQNDTLPKV